MDQSRQNQTQAPGYNLAADDCGVLIGLVSAPPDDKDDQFYTTYIKNDLLGSYRKGRDAFTLRNRTDNERRGAALMYDPVGFRVLGENDLMFFSLFDDFAFPNRVFHPFHGNGAVDENQDESAKRRLYQSYDYQLVIGLNLLGKDGGDRLDTLLLPSRLRKYAFSCVTRLKLNPIILCAGGMVYTALVKNKINQLSKDQGHNGLTAVLNGVGCDEMIVLNFANSLKDIAEFVFRIRNLRFADLDNADLKKEFGIVSEGLAEFDRIESDPEPKKHDYDDAHVFASSYSLSGYAIERGDLPERLNDDNCRISFNWLIKPGHITNFARQFNAKLEELKGKYADRIPADIPPDRLYMNNTIVKFDYEYDDTQFPSIAELLELLDEIRGIDIGKENSRKLQIAVSASDGSNLISGDVVPIFDAATHPSVRSRFKDFIYPASELLGLREMLDKCRMAKILKERIMKMYHLYNDCLTDPSFAVSTIGFRHFLDSIPQRLRAYSEKRAYTPSDIHDWLDNGVRDFEQAYLNRFHQSNRMRTLSDFNLEWNGGIQQLISSLDWLYKTFMACCGIKEYSKFMYVSGYERVHVSHRSYRVNMQHITYPELFASSVWKEMFNFLPYEYTNTDRQDKLPLRLFRREEFMNRLKSEISRHFRFNRARCNHQSFLNRINLEYMSSIVADALAYVYGYAKDYRAFFYWYARNTQQTSVMYGPDGTVDEQRLIGILGRLLIVHKIFEVEEPSLEELRFHGFDGVFGPAWIANFEDVNTMADIIVETLRHYGFRKDIEAVGRFILTNTYPDEYNELLVKLDSGTGSGPVAPELLEAAHSALADARGRCSDEFTRMLLDGRFDIGTVSHERMLVGNFLPAFLKALRDLDSENCPPSASHTLWRDDNGAPLLTLDNAGLFSNILADPLGGTFCIDGNIQRRYFQLRSVFMLVLFHFYHRNIVSLMSQRQNNR